MPGILDPSYKHNVCDVLVLYDSNGSWIFLFPNVILYLTGFYLTQGLLHYVPPVLLTTTLK